MRPLLPNYSTPRTDPQHGFALVIALSLMAFVLLLLLSLITFVQVESAQSEMSQDRQLARMNALVGLEVALGELQKTLGPDQRVSATADLAGGTNGARLANGDAPNNDQTLEATPRPNGLSAVQAGTRFWTGAWGNRDAALDAFGKTPSPHLLSWLVSGNASSFSMNTGASQDHGQIQSVDSSAVFFTPAATITPPLTTSVHANDRLTISRNEGVADAVLLVGPGTAGTTTVNVAGYTEPAEDRYVVAPLVDIGGINDGLSGRYGYWVGDESIKARVNLVDPYASRSNTTGTSQQATEARYRLMTAPRSGAELIGANAADFPLKPYLTDATQTGGTADRILHYSELPFLTPNPESTKERIRTRFQSLTTFSEGILADSLNGGLRQDLTHLLSQDNLPANLEDSTGFPAGILPAPYSPLTVVNGRTDVPVPTWGLLHSYYQMSEEVGQTGAVEIRPQTETQMGVFPMVSTVKIMAGYRYQEDLIPDRSSPETGSKPLGHYFYSPVFVLTNPYDVPIELKSDQDLYFSVLLQRREEKTASPVSTIDLGADGSHTMSSSTPIEMAGNTSEDPSTADHLTGLIKNLNREDGEPGASTDPYLRFNFSWFRPASHGSFGYTGMMDYSIFYVPELTLAPGEKKIFRIKGIRPRYDFWANPAHDASRYELEESTADQISTEFTYIYQVDFDGYIENPPESGTFEYFPIQYGEFYITDGESPSSYLPYSLEMRVGPNRATLASTSFDVTEHLLTIGDFDWSFERLVDESDPNAEDQIGGQIYDVDLQNPAPAPGEDGSLPFTGIYYVATWSYNYPGNQIGSLDGDINSHLRAFADHNPRASYFGTAGVGLGLPVPYQQDFAGKADLALSSWEFPPLVMGTQLDGWGFKIDDPTISNGVFFHLPRTGNINRDPPLFSIAQLQHANLTAMDGVEDAGFDFHWSQFDADSRDLHHYNQGVQPAYAVGNSYNSAYVRNALSIDFLNHEPQTDNSTGANDRRYFDISYLLNTALWNGYFFSTLPQDASSAKPANPRLKSLTDDPAAISPPGGTAPEDAGKWAATQTVVDGAFNINSTSVDAWIAALGGMRALPDLPLSPSDNGIDSVFPRNIWQPGDVQTSFSRNDPASYNGYRNLTEQQVRDLAEAIVQQIRLRGPFLSLGQFVNRALTDTNGLGDSGALQAAIDSNGADLNATDASAEEVRYSQNYTGSADFPAEDKQGGVINDFFRSAAVPGWLTQADLLQAIGSFISARSDTFTIRAYGEATNSISGRVTGRAWCEAIVMRRPEYINSDADGSMVDPPNLADATNQRFGRRFEVISFRWLTTEEI